MTASAIHTYQLPHNSPSGATLVEVLASEGAAPVPKRADFLRPHRKDYYMLALVTGGHGRHWVDMQPYDLQPDTLYFSTLAQVHVKEQGGSLTDTLVYFTAEFLALSGDARSAGLPLLTNPAQAHTLRLPAADQALLTTLFAQLLREFRQPGPWQHALLGAYLRPLLVHLSRLYEQQYPAAEGPRRQAPSVVQRGNVVVPLYAVPSALRLA